MHFSESISIQILCNCIYAKIIRKLIFLKHDSVNRVLLLFLDNSVTRFLVSLPLSASKKPSYSRCLNMDVKYWTKSLPHRIFSSLHYIDKQYTTDEGVHYRLTSYSYKALRTERISARFESPSHISLDPVDRRQLFQAYWLSRNSSWTEWPCYANTISVWGC